MNPVIGQIGTSRSNIGDSFELPLSSAITGFIKPFQIIAVSHTLLR